LLAGLVVGCECVVRERDEIEPVAAVVADLDERLVGVGLHDGSDRSGRPSAGVDFELDDVEDLVVDSGHVGIGANPPAPRLLAETASVEWLRVLRGAVRACFEAGPSRVRSVSGGDGSGDRCRGDRAGQGPARAF
jgi:hypothetical protein